MKTMILDNNLDNIKIYDSAGVDRIFIDLEILGKVARQGHLDTVISDHSIDDIYAVKSIINNSSLLVRVNPINSNSQQEIESVIEAGADIIMLPMFKTAGEVQSFIDYIDGRARTCLLIETSEALARIDDILEVPGIDEVHIGLNDLHLSLGLSFMFELLSGSLVEYLIEKLRLKGIPYGVGGISTIGTGTLSADVILKEHVRLGSTQVILSRAFKNHCKSLSSFNHELNMLQRSHSEALQLSHAELLENKLKLQCLVKDILKK
ncbi:aldolase/citrate lyase family protein [Photobacterium leiognathi]|uniref:aldolase/citrate lyase family protein n=1 Tax=Photobacterium leiognathi TaxID=553611 RepID=UPI002981CA48|nr:aldolase/citrate lyase family protein [Photobacterium leiognathi]